MLKLLKNINLKLLKKALLAGATLWLICMAVTLGAIALVRGFYWNGIFLYFCVSFLFLLPFMASVYAMEEMKYKEEAIAEEKEAQI